MERSFKKEVELLRLGEGEVFHGEGILAVTKALLQSGVSYVGGYQGAPVSHLMDVLADAQGLLNELGIHLCHYPADILVAFEILLTETGVQKLNVEPLPI